MRVKLADLNPAEIDMRCDRGVLADAVVFGGFARVFCRAIPKAGRATTKSSRHSD